MAARSKLQWGIIALEILCCVIAVALICYGADMYKEIGSIQHTEVIAVYGIIIGVTAVFVWVLNLLGFGTCNGKCCFIPYIIFSFLVLVFQILLANDTRSLPPTAATQLARVIDNAWTEQVAGKPGMDSFQISLKCCGAASPNDYVVYGLPMPKSCFKNGDNSTEENLYERGCRAEIPVQWSSTVYTLPVLPWILIPLEILTSILLVYDFSIRRRKKIRFNHV